MQCSIASLGAEIPGDAATYIRLDSNLSLLDWDIAVVWPTLWPFVDERYDTYQGRPALSDNKSFQLTESTDHWRREIADAVGAGKVVFVLLEEVQEVFVATGEKRYSGSGRNRQTTRVVATTGNYAMLPASVSPTNSKGKAMVVDPKASCFTGYWQDLSSDSEYRVAIENRGMVPLVRTRSGSRVVGGYLLNPQSGGAIVFLPYVDFDRRGFVTKKNGKSYWTQGALQLGARFIAAIVALSDAIRNQSATTPAPEWVASERFRLASEAAIRQELLRLESALRKTAEAIASQKDLLLEETAIKGLLFEKGKPLEAAVVKALRDLGFSARPYRQSDSEFDVVFEAKEGRLLAEVEGKDNRAVNIEKLRQLQMNISEDFAREEVTQVAKGVLVGNAFRLTDPSKRGAYFTDKCCTAANKSNTALVRSVDLFMAAREAVEKGEVAASQHRRRMVDGVGVVEFSFGEIDSRIEQQPEVAQERDAAD